MLLIPLIYLNKYSNNESQVRQQQSERDNNSNKWDEIFLKVFVSFFSLWRIDLQLICIWPKLIKLQSFEEQSSDLYENIDAFHINQKISWKEGTIWQQISLSTGIEAAACPGCVSWPRNSKAATTIKLLILKKKKAKHLLILFLLLCFIYTPLIEIISNKMQNSFQYERISAL